jgi:signal transduction histidine kinase
MNPSTDHSQGRRRRLRPWRAVTWLLALPGTLPRMVRWLLALPGAMVRVARRLRPAGGDRQAPTWRRTAREASDVRSLQEAFRRLAAAPAELLVGPEPPPLPPPAAGGRLGWLRDYRGPILWLAALALLAVNTQYLTQPGRVQAGPALLVAAAIALPLGVAAARPLRAWRLLVPVAAAVPLVVPPESPQAPPWPASLMFVALYVLYAVAVRLDLHLVVGVWLVTDAVILWSYLATQAGRDNLQQAYVSIIFATVVIAFGYLAGTRRRLQHELVEGEQRQQRQHARSALLEERARIARELHDIVAHHMSVIAVRTETAPFRIPELSQAAKDDMAETSAIAREALTEMRRLLGVLRGADSDAERGPQPGMDRLDGLLAAVRGAGLAVDLHVIGTERPLPSGVELSAYRIIQEALSNALRHAPGATATVEVGYEPHRLWLRVHNGAPPTPGAQRPPTAPGQGIIGMRERVAMLGGKLVTGATPEGGYLVEAVVPLDNHHDQEPS